MFEKTGKKFGKHASIALEVIPQQQAPFSSLKKPLQQIKPTPYRVEWFALETNDDPTTQSNFAILAQPQPGGKVE